MIAEIMAVKKIIVDKITDEKMNAEHFAVFSLLADILSAVDLSTQIADSVFADSHFVPVI